MVEEIHQEMMYRTHLAFAFFLALLFVEHVRAPLLFVGVVLACSLFPDIDHARSFLGQHWLFKPVQWLTRHRGMLHSFTLCIAVAVLAALLLPWLALPLFLGYSSHLVADAATREGIRPWWPSKSMIQGPFRTSGSLEQGIFYALLLASVLLLARVMQ